MLAFPATIAGAMGKNFPAAATAVTRSYGPVLAFEGSDGFPTQPNEADPRGAFSGAGRGVLVPVHRSTRELMLMVTRTPAGWLGHLPSTIHVLRLESCVGLFAPRWRTKC